MTPLVPAGLVFLLSLGTYFSLSIPLSGAGVDTSFYEDSENFNRFSSRSSSPLFGSTIENDTSMVRDYLLNGTFSLYWRDKTKNSFAEERTGNAFLLNILYPEDMGDDDPGRPSYVPKYYASGDELVFLLGTTFSFAKELFGKINNWGQEVNESATAPTLKTKKSSNNSGHKLYISHPQPSRGKEENSRMTQDTAYKLDDSISGRAIGMDKPFYFELDDGNVELVYAARDLKVNKNIVDLGLNGDANSVLERNVADEDWISEVGIPLSDKKYKLFVDFAVLKVKVKMVDLQNPFLAYLTKLYKKEERIPAILRDEMAVRGGRTNPVFMGGWTSLTEEEREWKVMENLFVKANVKKEKVTDIGNKLPKEINENNFEEYLDLEIYEKYSQMFSSSAQSQKSTNYVIAQKTFSPNDTQGLLYVNYWIKNKNNHATSEKKTVIYSGFKRTQDHIATGDISREINEDRHMSDMKKVEFLETSPRGIATWRELEIKHTYFDSFNIRKKLLSSVALGDGAIEDGYLNISHQLDVPNLNLESSGGMLALMQNPQNEKFMMGMYEKTREWNNFLSGKRHVGKIMMFVSPLRYDLFNQNNRLSKPSLADSLCKKNLSKRIIQVNRFFISPDHQC